MLKNYIKLTIKVLKRKRVLTIVTMIGIVCPFLLIILTTSFLAHIDNYNSPRKNFENVVYLDELTWKEIKDDGSVNQNMGNPPNLSFIQKYVKPMKTPKNVAIVSNLEQENIYMNNKPFEIGIKYTDNAFWEITDFEFLDGRAYNKDEYSKGQKIIVIDEKTSIALFNTVNSIGETLSIKNENFKVVGIIKNVDITYFRISANAYIPYTCHSEYSAKSIWCCFSRALILLDRKSDLKKVQDEFQTQLKQVSFNGFEPMNYIEGLITQDNFITRIQLLLSHLFHVYNIENYVLYFLFFLLFFLFIILPAINLVNINVNRIYERLSEVGVRRSYGATIKKLVGQFLIENLIITFLGAMISVILALIIIYFINSFDLLFGIYIKLSIKAVLISIMAFFILGLLSGLTPALNMARKKIVLSLNAAS